MTNVTMCNCCTKVEKDELAGKVAKAAAMAEVQEMAPWLSAKELHAAKVSRKPA